MRGPFVVLMVVLFVASLAVTTTAAADPAATDPCEQVLCAGAASVDMTWHVGAGQGQHGSSGGQAAGKFDPFHHQTKQVPTDGLQSRTYAKAIVVQGPDGNKVAYVKTELYLQQDVLTRRVAQLVAGDPVAPEYAVDGLDGSRIMLGATHNHSVPMYASMAWGVWLFTDSFDFRMFETTARRIARAIKEADAALRPARVGAAVTRYDDVQHNVLGPAVADDGSPAGFPRDHFDDELAVIRFDTADGSRPIAALVNLGLHPESQETTDLISSDFVGQVERIVERGMGRAPGSDEGPVAVWSQGAVGDVEPDRNRANPPEEGRYYWYRDYQQMERMSRDLSTAILDTWEDVARPAGERGGDHVPDRSVGFTTDAPVGMVDERFTGPTNHTLPTVSNCRTQDPGVPAIGLPDCNPNESDPPEQYGETLDLLHDHGVPVPDNYGPTSYGAVQESTRIHLQAIRIGEILLATCPCEPVSDMVLNFKSRTDTDQWNLYDGYDWPCREGDNGIECDFRHASWHDPDWRPVDRAAYELMKAQIHNDAAGWEEDHAHLQGEVEHGSHDDGHDLHGNFTKREIQHESCGGASCDGYTLPLMVGQANDYIGYVVTYREYQRGDHYRKALTAFGPHTADYVNTRLVQMGAQLKGGEGPSDSEHAPVEDPVDELLQTAKVLAVGQGGSAALAAYEEAIPDDGGEPGAVVSEPQDLRRYDAATFCWQGGSNWTDDPQVVVQRQQADGSWTTVATQEGGEIVTTLAYESPSPEAALDWLSGGKTYEWTAIWEVFDRTAPGTYRLAVDGFHRRDRQPIAYEASSRPFTVDVWDGIVAHDLTIDGSAGTASVAIDGVELDHDGPLETDEDAVLSPDEVHLPDTYDTDGPYIEEEYTQEGPHVYCVRCSYRPWADTARVSDVTITVHQSDGVTATYPATFDGERWSADGLDLADGDVVVVEPAGARDEFGDINGRPSNPVTVTGVGPRIVATELTYTGDRSGTIGGDADVSAVLTTAAGDPVAGATVTFSRGDHTATAVTDAAGTAATQLKVGGPAGDGEPLAVAYAGDATHEADELSIVFAAHPPGSAGGRDHGGAGAQLASSRGGPIGGVALALVILALTVGGVRRWTLSR